MATVPDLVPLPIAPVHACLRDGTPIVIRAVRPADRARVAALFARMSPLSIRHRFLCVKRGLSEAELDFLLGNGTSHVVLAAVAGDGATEEVRGLGRYVVFDDQPDTAEVAFEVGDADQGHGIGTLLLARLAQIARERGVTAFRAEVEADNAVMLDVFKHSGLAVHGTCARGVYDVGMPTAVPRPAQPTGGAGAT
jgi:GNAT superfamily N-acetyltransferase